MTTIKYGRYVCVNKEKGLVVWYESKQSAMDNQKENGGELYDMEEDDMEEIENALYEARKVMGVE